jgi:hypothetical protein
MQPTEDFYKTPAAEEFFKRLKQMLLDTQRPPEQVVLDDADFCAFLKCSKRHAANLRAKREIKFSKSGGKIYYILSDILHFIKENEVQTINSQSNF